MPKEIVNMGSGLPILAFVLALAAYTRTTLSRYFDRVVEHRKSIRELISKPERESESHDLEEKLRRRIEDLKWEGRLVKIGDTVLVVLGVLLAGRIFLSPIPTPSFLEWPHQMPFTFSDVWSGFFGAAVIYLGLLHWDWWRHFLRMLVQGATHLVS